MSATGAEAEWQLLASTRWTKDVRERVVCGQATFPFQIGDSCRFNVEGRLHRWYLTAMRMIFIYGPVASGKLTVGRLVAEKMGIPLFHNHLIVDAVGAVFPFGSSEFVRLREQFWLETISAAAISGRSLIFTFAPEPSVSSDFPGRVSSMVAEAGGRVTYIALELEETEQELRLANPARERFGKLRSLDLLRELRPSMAACMKSMPEPELRIDTGTLTPTEAADAIVRIVTAAR